MHRAVIKVVGSRASPDIVLEIYPSATAIRGLRVYESWKEFLKRLSRPYVVPVTADALVDANELNKTKKQQCLWRFVQSNTVPPSRAAGSASSITAVHALAL